MKHYPTHEEIYEQIRKLVNGNCNHASMHNRESLDDLIADLEQYRNTIPSIEEYLEVNEL
jgi:hypothetical protein